MVPSKSISSRSDREQRVRASAARLLGIARIPDPTCRPPVVTQVHMLKNFPCCSSKCARRMSGIHRPDWLATSFVGQEFLYDLETSSGGARVWNQFRWGIPAEPEQDRNAHLVSARTTASHRLTKCKIGASSQGGLIHLKWSTTQYFCTGFGLCSWRVNFAFYGVTKVELSLRRNFFSALQSTWFQERGLFLRQSLKIVRNVSDDGG